MIILLIVSPDLDAPIVPNESAAGIQIGADAREIVERASLTFTFDPPDKSRSYSVGVVLLWVRAGTIHQIGVIGGYRGRIDGRIGIGSTIADVEDAFGRVLEDDEDNLVVSSLPGWCFETEPWVDGDDLRQNRFARITAIYVFRR